MPNRLFHVAANPIITYDESFVDTFSYRKDSHARTRFCQIDGSDLLLFKSYMLGFSIFGDPKAGLQRFRPEQHPDDPNLYCTAVDSIRELAGPGRAPLPIGQNAGGGPIQQAMEVQVQYEWPPDAAQMLPDFMRPALMPDYTQPIPQPLIPFPPYFEFWRYVGVRKDYDVANQPIPREKLQFALTVGGSNNIPAAGSIIIPSATLYYFWYEVPAVQNRPSGTWGLPLNIEQNIQLCQGRINTYYFDGMPPSTLLHAGTKRELFPMGNGLPCFRITYILAQRGLKDLSSFDSQAIPPDTTDPNWNRILRGNGSYSYVIKRDGSGPLYPSTDLNKLFFTL